MAKDDSSSRLINNSSYLMADWIIVTILSLMFWIIVGKTLPSEGYGIVATSMNLALLIAAFGLIGLPSAATNLISKFQKRGEYDKTRGLIRFSLKFALILDVAAAIVMVAFSSQISAVIHLPIEAVWLVSLLLFGWTFWLLTNGILQGFQNMRLIFRSNFAGNIVKVAIPIALFFFTVGYIGPLAAVILHFATIIAIRYSAFKLRGRGNIEAMKTISEVALPVFIASVMWLVFTNLPNVILNTLKSPDVTGIFAITLTIVSPITFIPMTLSQALFPITSGLSVTKNPHSRQKKLISLVIKYAAFITLPLVALLLVFSSQVILFFSQPEYLPAGKLLPVVAAAALLLGIGQILVSSIFAIGKIKMTRNITIASTIFFIAISIPLSIAFSSTGMAISYFIAMSALALASYIYLNRSIKFSMDWSSLIKIATGVLVFTSITYPMNAAFDSIIIKLFSILIGTVAYLVALYVLKFYSKDEIKIIEHLANSSSSLGKILNPVLDAMKSRKPK